MGLVRAYLARGSYHGLYYSIEKPLKFFQTGALLEVRLEGLGFKRHNNLTAETKVLHSQTGAARHYMENAHFHSGILMICCTLLLFRMAFGNVE